jgi:translation initiation factor IF-3
MQAEAPEASHPSHRNNRVSRVRSAASGTRRTCAALSRHVDWSRPGAPRARTAAGPFAFAQGPLHQEKNDQGGPISSEPRINDRIRVPEVRLVGPEGEQVGIVPIGKALELAAESDLDLVEVAPMARPPVCKLMDYGKFKYESAQKAREARRNQALTVIKEMKLRPKIDSHDYETKKGHVERFLKAGDKVKVTIMFRGREQSRPELGFRLLQRGFVESSPKQDGRNMIMVVAPHRNTSSTRATRASRENEIETGADGAA